MNATPVSKKHQQLRVSKACTTTDNLAFFNLLTSDKVLHELEDNLPEHRERVFPPTETLSLFLTQVMSSDQSCQQVVNGAAIARLAMGLPACSTSTGAYCKARQRLPIDLVSSTCRSLGEQLCAQAPDQWLWRKRRVLLADGTTVTMLDTAENQASFPQQGGQLPGLGFPICRIVAITCLSSCPMRQSGSSTVKAAGKRAYYVQCKTR